MQIGPALIAAAAVLVIGGGVSAYAVTPRYSLGNPGGGVSVRLDRRSGDMIGCQALDCQPLVRGGNIVAGKVPPIPAGWVLERPASQTGRP